MFNFIPYGYDELNLIEGTYTPSETKNRDNFAYHYWLRSLFQRASSTLEFTLPDNWSAEAKQFFIYCILRFGYVVVFDNSKNGTGISFQPCTLYGYDLYYQPTNAIVSNPKLSADFTLHKDAELIKLTPDYLGIWDILDYYAVKLANISCSIDMTLENSKVAFVFAGKTKSARETIKKIFDKISKGQTCVATDSTVASPNGDIEPFTWLTRNVKDSYIGGQLLQDAQTILNMFDREIGIPTIPYQKKERMVEFESESALLDASSRLSVWIESLEDSIANVNAMFDTSISVEARIDLDSLNILEGGEGNE